MSGLGKSTNDIRTVMGKKGIVNEKLVEFEIFLQMIKELETPRN